MSHAELGEIRLSRAHQLDYFRQNDPGESIASRVGAVQDQLAKIDACITRVEEQQQKKDYPVSQLNCQG